MLLYANYNTASPIAFQHTTRTPRSLIFQDGRLLPIAASRADVFKDRSLSLAEKRSLSTFLSVCLAAAEGQGQLAVRVCSVFRFVSLLQAEMHSHLFRLLARASIRRTQQASRVMQA
jgi:hypothetical protein